MTAPEFSRRVRLDEIGSTPRSHPISADAEERVLLAGRFDLLSLDELSGDISLSREAAGVRARGRIHAAASQKCVVSGQPMAVRLDEPIDVLFTFSAASGGTDEEVELSAADCDAMPLEGDAVDIGELAAETMSLALDPYPRLPDAELDEFRRLLTSEEDAEAAAEADKAARNPFSALKKQP